jgi:hypothetical protein
MMNSIPFIQYLFKEPLSDNILRRIINMRPNQLTMKKKFYSIVLLSGISTFTFAQVQSHHQPGHGKPQSAQGTRDTIHQKDRYQQQTPDQRAEKMTERLTQDLALTADQKTKVKALLLQQEQDKKALSDRQEQDLKALLTPDQQAKFETSKPRYGHGGMGQDAHQFQQHQGGKK